VLGAIVLGILGVGAALYSYFLVRPTVLSAVGAREADPGQFQQLHNIVQTFQSERAAGPKGVCHRRSEP